MKKNTTTLPFILLIAIALSNCTTSYVSYAKKTYGEKIPYQTLECSTTDKEEIDVFFQTDSIDFSYEEVGYVTAYAQLGIPDSLIIKRLQYNSYLLCGNGVIQVTAAKTIKEGLMQNEYTGIAVIIDKDSVYNSKHPFEANYSFYDFAITDYTSEVEETSPFGNFMLGVGTVAAVILIILLPNEEEEEIEEGI